MSPPLDLKDGAKERKGMENETPVLSLYAVRLSKNGNYLLITFCEGKKPNRTFRKWILPVEKAKIVGNDVQIDLHLETFDKKKVADEQIAKNRESMREVDDDDCPF
jgi:hypothetical protein